MDRFGLVWTVVILSVIWRISGQRQCPRLQKPWNGQFIGSCNRNIGSECIFQCREPYILVGSRVRTCQRGGAWTGQTASCQLDGCSDCNGGGSSNCVSLYDPENGYTEGQCTPGLIGQTCRFTCYPGYSVLGQSSLICLNGQWSSTAPVCSRTSAAICDSIIVQNGVVVCTQQGDLTVCSITCDDSYMIVGSSVVTCSSSGNWNDIIPSCRPTGVEVSNVCSTLFAPEGGRLVGSCTSAVSGDTCQLVCLSGYRPTDTRVLICQSNGRWSDSLPRCSGDTSSGCPRISITYGSVSEACSSSSTGQYCTITCDSGYTLTGGSGTLVCQSNGQWSGNIPTCTQARSCPVLPAPSSGGTFGTCSPGQVGLTCTFYCNSGYQLIGQASLVCGNDGQWSGNAPYCTGGTCPSLDTPTNGARSGSCTQATVGQSCSFSCQAGYILTGQSTLYCQAGSVWSSSAPTCNRLSSCPYLNAPINGFANGACSQASVGQSCTFSCQAGYTLSGQSTLYCQAGGQWSSSTPTCIRGTSEGGNCPVLTPPPNAQFLECDNRSGGQCIVVCERGYTRSGSRVRTCLSQGTWSGYSPTCTRTDCCS